MAALFHDFVHDLRFEDLPSAVVDRAKFWLVDLLGVAAAGSRTELSRIIREHVCAHFLGARRQSRLVFDGRPTSPVGAALATGMTIDSVDAHDGHRLTKGHAGCGALAAVLAVIDAEPFDDEQELLVALVMGYEIGTRAGIALHRTAAQYHTSGAWISVACAAIGARLLRLPVPATREAVGIGEFHGPRGLMMRCIDHPTMVKDGSGWGAMAGVSAAYLARDGFTGAPASVVDSVSVADVWSDLGARWHIFDQYYKAYPVCRWAQPAVEAALALKAQHAIHSRDISRVEVASFTEAVRLGTRRPETTEQAQYSLPFPVAAALVKGRLGVRETTGTALHDPETLRLSDGMMLVDEPAISALFPARRLARVRIVLRTGATVSSREMEAIGEPENPVSTQTAQQKFFAYAEPVLGASRCERIVEFVCNGETHALLNEIFADSNL